TDLVGNRLQSGGAHLAGRTDRETIAGDDERLPAMDARPEVRHQIAERAGLPALVERFQAFGDAGGRRRDLIGVDRSELLLLPEDLQVPENERLSADGVCARRGRNYGRGGDGVCGNARLQPCWSNALHV